MNIAAAMLQDDYFINHELSFDVTGTFSNE